MFDIKTVFVCVCLCWFICCGLVMVSSELDGDEARGSEDFEDSAVSCGVTGRLTEPRSSHGRKSTLVMSAVVLFMLPQCLCCHGLDD